ncbi:MAG: HEAT repeat domain-containing protein [Myxococcota bacterium]|nr:HEAT repeat domain-containing protein [Myxococcota bacterium]
MAAALLEGLVPRKDPRAIEVLALYSRNRNPELRHRAVQALGEIHDAQVVPLLVAALSDGSAEVRAAAAAALGARREKSAERPLLRLLQRQDPAAPAALGQIGGPETARTLAEMVGNIPDRLVVQTLGELLKRADFGPDPLRLEVVRTLGKIPGNEALDALTDYLKLSSKDRTRPSRVEASKIIEQRTAK